MDNSRLVSVLALPSIKRMALSTRENASSESACNSATMSQRPLVECSAVTLGRPRRLRITPSGNLHGMPAARRCGHGPSSLTSLGGVARQVAPADIRQIGIRRVDAGEKRLLQDVALEVMDLRTIDELGMRRAMTMALSGLDDDAHLRGSFDVDFLDPDIAPGVGTTMRGGPTYREAQLCMETIADTGRLSALDVVELNPAFDVCNRTAGMAVELIESLFGRSTLMRC